MWSFLRPTLALLFSCSSFSVINLSNRPTKDMCDDRAFIQLLRKSHFWKSFPSSSETRSLCCSSVAQPIPSRVNHESTRAKSSRTASMFAFILQTKAQNFQQKFQHLGLETVSMRHVSFYSKPKHNKHVSCAEMHVYEGKVNIWVLQKMIFWLHKMLPLHVEKKRRPHHSTSHSSAQTCSLTQK